MPKLHLRYRYGKQANSESLSVLKSGAFTEGIKSEEVNETVQSLLRIYYVLGSELSVLPTLHSG